MLEAAARKYQPTPIAERPAVDAQSFAELIERYEPVVLRGQVARWPGVQAGRQGGRAAAAYLARFAGGEPLDVMAASPDAGGRFFYNDDFSGFNFGRQRVPLPVLLEELLRQADADEPRPPALYANALAAPKHLPGWAEENALDLPTGSAVPRLWIGNASRVATHYDESTNVACVVAGRRRFTLFPPDQIANLYIGPIDRTMAGPPSSLADPDAPDLVRFPRFEKAMAHARVAELEPGDAILIPALWWHHVRALDRLNVLVNYWWNRQGDTSPFLAMVHALMSVRDLPPGERAVWRQWFDHYVFADAASTAAAYLPPHARGVLGPAGRERTQRIRTFLIRMLGGQVQP